MPPEGYELSHAGGYGHDFDRKNPSGGVASTSLVLRQAGRGAALGAGDRALSAAPEVGPAAAPAAYRRELPRPNGPMNTLRPSAIEQIAPDRVLVPLDAIARPIRDQKVTALQPKRLGENWIGPILPFEPMRGLGDAH